ncbi:hypothetical protein HC931_27810 [Candidatus Gracilibacteria bacterium]|nr:hypothetical protein [Candidatus Gracilibacteria bacterium]
MKEIGDIETKKLLQAQSKLEQEKEKLSQRQQEVILILENQEKLKKKFI